MLEIFQDIRPIASIDPPHGYLFRCTREIERFALVCQRWKSLIESRPSFWNVLLFQIGYGKHIREALRWLSRSGTIQLHVFIFDDFIVDDFPVDGPVGADNADFIALTQSLWRVLPRIRSLSLWNPTPKLYQFFWPGSDSAITPAPPLSPIPLRDLSSLSLYLHKGVPTERQLIQSLTQVPKLKNLWVDGSFERDKDDPTSCTASFPGLKQLSLLQCPKSLLDLLEFPSWTAVHIQLLPNDFPYQNQATRNKIIADLFPSSFFQSSTITFSIGSRRNFTFKPQLDIWHENTPAGGQCHVYLSIGPEISAPNHGAALQLATKAFENLESIELVRLKVGVELLPMGLVEWTMGLPNLRVLELAGKHASKVLGDPLFAEISRHPRLQTFAISKESSSEVATQLRSMFAASRREQHPVKLEFHQDQY